jgi:hypothetical protein
LNEIYEDDTILKNTYTKENHMEDKNSKELKKTEEIKEKNNNIDNNKSKEENKNLNTQKLLNILLAIIVIITVLTGTIVYYSLYKYSDVNEVENETNKVTNETVSTVADMINTVIDSSNDEDKNLVINVNTTVTTGEADSRKILNESIIVLYDGLILDSESMGLVELKYIDNSSPTKDDYVVTYYNYSNYGYQNSSLGVLSSQVLDGLVKIDNVGKISISEKYEAIPREVQVVNSIPAVVSDNNSDFSNYDTKKTIIIDLDGNGTNEYIVILANKSTGESKIVLAESTGFVKATLATMDKSGWDSTDTDGYYLSYSNIEVLDIDNDGIMEILFELPTKDVVPSQISLLKYKNGELSGKTDLACSLVK